jgi:hypothetical protein
MAFSVENRKNVSCGKEEIKDPIYSGRRERER